MLNKRKNNILYTTSFPHMIGGGQWSLYYLIKHLDKTIFHPIVVCPAKGELSERMRGVGAEVVFFDVGRIRYLNPLVIKKFVSLVKEKRIALIHTDSTTETFYAGIAAQMMRIPLVWHIRVSEEEWVIDRVLATLSTKLILVANAIKNRFAWLSDHHKMIVVYNGIDFEEFDHFPAASSIRQEFNITKDTVLVGCIGRIEKRKGQEYLVSAMKHVDSTKLILVGTGEKEYIRKIKMLCDEIGTSDRVMFLGSRDDIPSVLNEIDILVFPSIRGEGFPRVILEAMAAGKPVVATDDGGNREAVEDALTGYLIPTENISALAAKINELVGDKHKRMAMGQAGRRRVEECFTVQHYVQSIQEIYWEIIGK